VLILVILLGTRDLGSGTAAAPTAPPTPSADIVAQVNGEPVSRSDWLEAVIIDQLMSRLAREAPPTPRETLDRLINEALVRQGRPQTPPSDAEVAASIDALEEAWGVDDAVLTEALAGVGLSRASLAEVIARLLMLQRTQDELEAEGSSIAEWLEDQRAAAEIVVYEDLADAGNLPQLVAQVVQALPEPTPSAPPSSLATPVASPLSTPVAALETAPDFTLERAGGGTLTLSQELRETPVVLVFFQKCG
jgi:hypothetical protein